MFKNFVIYFNLLNVCLNYLNGTNTTKFPVPKRQPKDVIKTKTGLDNYKLEMLENFRYSVEQLCPYGDFCQTNRTRNESLPPFDESNFDPCCKDCSCDTDCGLDNQTVCCFPSSANFAPKQQMKCISVEPKRIRNFDDPVPSYYMVSHCPDNPNDYADQKSDIAEFCSENDSLRSLEPVFSRSRQLIYKNKYCAQCHNISDVYAWKSIMMCKTYNENIFYYISRNKLPPDCYIRFEYPASLADIQHNRCCLGGSTYMYPNKILHRRNMSHTNIVALCENGLYSPYTYLTLLTVEVFANVFCFLCNMQMYDNLLPVLCQKKFYDQRSQTGFISILNRNVFDAVTRRNKMQQELIEHKVCRILTSNVSDCRQLFCPSGKVYDSAGKCVYVSKDWMFNSYFVSLKLVPEKPLAAHVLDDFNDINNMKSQLKHSWPNHWSIVYMFAQTKTCSDRSALTCVSYFGVTLGMKNSRRSGLKIIASVKNMVNKDWFIKPNATSFRLKCHFLDLDTKNVFNMELFRKHQDITVIYSKFYISQGTLLITKFFYCKQIALKENEYSWFFTLTSLRTLYLKKIDRGLFEQQFEMRMSTNGTIVPTLCVSDTQFQATVDTSCAHLYKMGYLNDIVLLLFADVIHNWYS